ncbi:hypothetical protein H5410_041221 [Solanum commersonii]|uniref:Uncharacterized protein n=1 Tax=Solanum commersonii TaxID=4109 RepID=A0A9J5XQY8_SOLCO|nr:hypothetical protein H5410_041221 [Solanum commersonii]
MTIPKYCKTCNLQDHKKEECFIIHPELKPTKEERHAQREKHHASGTRVLHRGKVVGPLNETNTESKEMQRDEIHNDLVEVEGKEQALTEGIQCSLTRKITFRTSEEQKEVNTFNAAI